MSMVHPDDVIGTRVANRCSKAFLANGTTTRANSRWDARPAALGVPDSPANVADGSRAAPRLQPASGRNQSEAGDKSVEVIVGIWP